MKRDRGFRVLPFSVNRRAAAASAAIGRENDTIHTLTEVDITEPRRLIYKHREQTGERLSLTAYVVACLAQVVAENPIFNSMCKGNKLIILDDVTISVLFERNIKGESVPEPIGIRAADKKTFRQIHDEIRAAQQRDDERLGALSGAVWFRFIPSFLFKAFIRVASRSVRMAKLYGVMGVTAVGMFSPSPMWLIPLSGATLAVAVGGIVKRPVFIDGHLEEREHLCLTISFDHDIIDGAPAARFTGRFYELLASGDVLSAVGIQQEP